MLDKWFQEGIDAILQKKNRMVITVEDKNAGFLYELIPDKYKIYQTGDDIEELRAKYEIEKNQHDQKVVIFTHRPRAKLKFIREYCETGGCIEIKYLHNYVKTLVHAHLGLNLQLTVSETATAAQISVGRRQDYWLDIIHKGRDYIFNMGSEVLPFLNDPQTYWQKRDKQVKKAFLTGLNQWLGRADIEQPPETLAKEAAEKILGALVQKDGDTKFKAVYHKWADSKQYEDALDQYIADTQVAYRDDIWAVDAAHPFADIDRQWLIELTQKLSRNPSDKTYLQTKLAIIKQRAAAQTGKTLYKTLWPDVITLLEFDPAPMNRLNSFEDVTAFYTARFYLLDTAVRRLYAEFLNEKEIIRPLQEYYQALLIDFLDKLWSPNSVTVC